MTSYAFAHLRRQPPLPEDVFVYMERIQETLDPFGGRFIVHGGEIEVREGNFDGVIVLIEFPDLEAARAWYDSAAYQEIKALRTDHVDGELLLLEGVSAGHDSAALAATLRAAQHG